MSDSQAYYNKLHSSIAQQSICRFSTQGTSTSKHYNDLYHAEASKISYQLSSQFFQELKKTPLMEYLRPGLHQLFAIASCITFTFMNYGRQ